MSWSWILRNFLWQVENATSLADWHTQSCCLGVVLSCLLTFDGDVLCKVLDLDARVCVLLWYVQIGYRATRRCHVVREGQGFPHHPPALRYVQRLFSVDSGSALGSDLRTSSVPDHRVRGRPSSQGPGPDHLSKLIVKKKTAQLNVIHWVYKFDS